VSISATRIQVARVLCGIDFSSCSERALKHAAAVARWYGAQLRTLHVFALAPPVTMLPPLASPPPVFTLTAADRQQVLAHMRQLGAAAGAGGAEPVLCESPNVAAEILDQALEWPADLVVLGSHGYSGLTRLVLGSVAEKVIRLLRCPVLIVPHLATGPVPPGDVKFDRILCAVDFSASSLAALAYGLSLGAETGARVTVLNTIEWRTEAPATFIAGEEEARARAEADHRQKLEALVPAPVRDYCEVETTVAEGKAAREILRQVTARQSDLIVLGLQGRGALDLAVFGSNAQDVVRRAACPVLIVPSPDTPAA